MLLSLKVLLVQSAVGCLVVILDFFDYSRQQRQYLSTAKQFGIAMQTLSNWHKKANQGKLVGTAQYDPDLMTALQKIKQLKRQLKVAEEEREILNEEG